MFKLSEALVPGAVALTAAALILEVVKFHSSDKKTQKELNTAVHSLLLVALLLILVKYQPTFAGFRTHKAAVFNVVVLLSIWAMRWHLQHQQLDHPTSGRREIIHVLDWLLLIYVAIALVAALWRAKKAKPLVKLQQ